MEAIKTINGYSLIEQPKENEVISACKGCDLLTIDHKCSVSGDFNYDCTPLCANGKNFIFKKLSL